MNTREAEAIVERSPAPAAGLFASAWKLSLSVLSLSLLALLVVYFDTFRSMAEIWSRSDTYVHGYFVLPISLYLIWTLRREVARIAPRTDTRALALIAIAGVGWLAARLGGVLVAEQYFAVATIPLMVWAVAGPGVFRRLLFPLLYLFLLVPVGEALLPALIDQTAAFAVAALRLVGVPVLQQGNLLTLPNSQWSVVEACSGLRYLIACVTIGLLFAYLTYRSWTRRALFIALSIAVPLVANWIRAFLIIYIGYSSDMALAVGVDHLIYGWVFYAVVMCLLLWVGSLFRDDGHPALEETPAEPRERGPYPIHRAAVVACAAILTAAVWPVWAGHAESRLAESAPVHVAFEFPETIGSFARAKRAYDWEPRYAGATFAGMSVYETADSEVALHMALYADQRQGNELVSFANQLVHPGDDAWRQLSRGSSEVPVPGGRLAVEERRLTGPNGELLVWRWYWISGRRTASPVWAKVIESSEKLLFRMPVAAGIVVATDAGDEESARTRLEEFLAEGFPAIESALEASFP
jgi:exosortase A